MQSTGQGGEIREGGCIHLCDKPGEVELQAAQGVECDESPEGPSLPGRELRDRRRARVEDLALSKRLRRALRLSRNQKGREGLRGGVDGVLRSLVPKRVWVGGGNRERGVWGGGGGPSHLDKVRLLLHPGVKRGGGSCLRHLGHQGCEETPLSRKEELLEVL